NSPYGRLMNDALREAAAATGGSVGKVEYLDPRNPDTTLAVQHVMGGSGAAGPAATATFDALLLPEGGAQLKQLAAQIKAAEGQSGKIQLLGSGLWDDPSIV